MTLEDSLVENLLKSYKAKDKNVQGVLDNQLFKDLPLDVKVRLINKYKQEFQQNPTRNFLSVLKDAGYGGLAGAATTAIGIAFSGGAKTGIPVTLGIGMGAAAGAVFGGISSSLMNQVNYNRDLKSKQHLNNPLKVLVDRSMSSPVSSPSLLAKVLSFFDGAPEKVGTKTHAFGEQVMKEP